MPNIFGYDDDDDAQPGTDDAPFGNVPARPDDEAEGDLEPSPLVAEAEPAEAPQETPQEPAAAAPAAAQPSSEAPAAPESTEPSAPTETPTEQLLAGRFRTQEDLERGYLNVRELHERTAARAREIEERNARLEQALEQATAVRQQPAPQPVPLDPQVIAAAQERGLDPEALPVIQYLAAQEADRRAEQMRVEQQTMAEQQAQQAEARAERDRWQSDVVAFQEAHPDVAPGSDLERAIADIIQNFPGGDLIGLTYDRGSLELAYDMVPDLRQWKVNFAIGWQFGPLPGE